MTWPVADLLPHEHPMVLLDEVVAWDDESLTAAVEVSPATRFADPNKGVPAHVGLEWMAQTCGAFAGVKAKETGNKVRLGFLLGTRDFTAQRPWFGLGERLLVSVKQVFHEDGMAVFDCRIDADGEPRARARLSVFQPNDGVEGMLA